jgi:hypothetical protein
MPDYNGCAYRPVNAPTLPDSVVLDGRLVLLQSPDGCPATDKTMAMFGPCGACPRKTND